MHDLNERLVRDIGKLNSNEASAHAGAPRGDTYSPEQSARWRNSHPRCSWELCPHLVAYRLTDRCAHAQEILVAAMEKLQNDNRLLQAWPCRPNQPGRFHSASARGLEGYLAP
jgi:hypothetical protein